MGVAHSVLNGKFISRMFRAFHIARSFDSLFIFYGESGFFFPVTLGTTSGALEILFHKMLVFPAGAVYSLSHTSLSSSFVHSAPAGGSTSGCKQQNVLKVIELFIFSALNPAGNDLFMVLPTSSTTKIQLLAQRTTAGRQTQFGGGDIFTSFEQFPISAADSQAEFSMKALFKGALCRILFLSSFRHKRTGTHVHLFDACLSFPFLHPSWSEWQEPLWTCNIAFSISLFSLFDNLSFS